MKTLTVTFHHTTNYGASLQTYALQHTIQSMGHENVVLETNPLEKQVKPKNTPMQWIRELYIRWLCLIRKKQLISLNQSFKEFHRNHLKLTRPYRTMEDLRSDEELKKIDCLITGSDQVWNLKTTPSFAPARLLDFGPDNCIRFSYAASIGERTGNYTDDQKEVITSSLKHYKGLSVREETARQYIESFTGYHCERVIDPVFLLDKEEWMEIAQKPRLNGPYILCYQVLSNTRMAEVAKYLKKKTGMPIVSICNSSIRWIKSDYSFHDVSIEEFLGFYNEAAYIVSTSFHGVAMGIVFGKPVFALVKKGSANRIENVMKVLGMEKHVVSQENNEPIIEYTDEELIAIDKIRSSERQNGLDFLNRMFS